MEISPAQQGRRRSLDKVAAVMSFTPAVMIKNMNMQKCTASGHMSVWRRLHSRPGNVEGKT